MGTLYDRDILAWANQQAALLRDRQWEKLDVEHLADEIASLGMQESGELGERFSLLLFYLLKWQRLPVERGSSWVKTVSDQRARIGQMLRRTPSLGQVMRETEWREIVWMDARDKAVHQADFDYDDLPAAWPWSVEQVLSPEFFPD